SDSRRPARAEARAARALRVDAVARSARAGLGRVREGVLDCAYARNGRKDRRDSTPSRDGATLLVRQIETTRPAQRGVPFTDAVTDFAAHFSVKIDSSSDAG